MNMRDFYFLDGAIFFLNGDFIFASDDAQTIYMMDLGNSFGLQPALFR